LDNNKENAAEAKPAIPDSSASAASFETPKSSIEHDETIKTDIDDLLRLVSARGEISMADAAKALDVSAQTVEAWSIFLEEDGVMEVKYKLTTPYLVAKNQTEARAAVQEKTDEIERGTKKQVLLKDTARKPSPRRAEMEYLHVPQLFKEASKEVDVLFNNAYQLIQEGKFEEANKIYEQIKQENETLPAGLKEFKKDISINLTKLNKDLIIHIERYNLRASS